MRVFLGGIEKLDKLELFQIQDDAAYFCLAVRFLYFVHGCLLESHFLLGMFAKKQAISGLICEIKS